MSNNKAREVNNPIIEELINQTSPEELSKIDAEMTNNKQQTAVEWYDNEIGKLFDQFTMGKIKIYEFQNQRLKLEKQAKEMEKEQHGKTWDTTATITNITHFCEVFEPAYKPSPTVATIIPCKKCGKSLWQHTKWTNTI